MEVSLEAVAAAPCVPTHCRDFAVGMPGNPVKSLFKSADQARMYAQFRPTYPDSLYTRLEAFAAAGAPAQQRQLALDVATGSGQVATVLAQSYQQVVACDVSQPQLDNAVKRPNIHYQLAPAEHMPGVAAESVDLATAAQCMHWFDVPAFYREMRRVLKPGGTLAVWGYNVGRLTSPPSRQYPAAALAEADRCMWDVYDGVLGPYWDSKRRLVETELRGLEPGSAEFGTVQRLQLSMHRDLSLEALAGYIASWSAYTTYRQQHPGRQDPLPPLRQQLVEVLQLEDSLCSSGEDGGEPLPVVRLEWPLFAILARDPVPLQPA